MTPRRAAACLLLVALVGLWILAVADDDSSADAWAGSTAAVNVFARGVGQPRPILNIAHGGASSLAPQNTLAAGRKAFAIGADVWGVDVRPSADGCLVLMHDDTLDRTTNVEALFPERAPWTVASFTLEEIRRLDAGSWFIDEDPFAQIEAGNVPEVVFLAYVGEPVPTLREALEFVATHGGLIDVEVKPLGEASREGIAARLVDLIHETGTAGRALVSSFDHDLLREVKRLDPSIPIGALAVLAPPNTVEYLDALAADVYLPSVVGFLGDLLGRLAERGIKVFVWTHNTESQLEYAIDLEGVAGIYTDFPQRLAALLDERFGTEGSS
ncbi:MAG: glycerophosphodiester phosphodiesterase family protein [Candidatus Bipolaricaulia bacterium]